MKYFGTVQKHLAILGIDSTRKPFNLKALGIFLLYAVNSALICIYLIRDTSNLKDSIIVIYMASASVLVTSFFVIIVVKMTKLFRVFECMEDIAKSSE